MSYVLRLMGLAWSPPGFVDNTAGQFVSAYDPTFDERGLIRTDPNPALALQFENFEDAAACWQQAHGTRPDGRPNRPLTAYNVMILSVEQAQKDLASERRLIPLPDDCRCPHPEQCRVAGPYCERASPETNNAPG